jgi:hypothetical protein
MPGGKQVTNKQEGEQPKQQEIKKANFSLTKKNSQAHQHFQSQLKTIQPNRHFVSFHQYTNFSHFHATSDADLKRGRNKYYSRPNVKLTDIYKV